MANFYWRLLTGWALMFLLLAGCEQAGPPAPSKVAKRARASGVAASEVFPNLSLEQALSQAKSDGKIVMVDFYTERCSWCKVLDQNTWTDAEVQTWLKEKTVPIKIDA